MHGGWDEGYNNTLYPWYAGDTGDTWGGNFGQSGLFAISGVIGDDGGTGATMIYWK